VTKADTIKRLQYPASVLKTLSVTPLAQQTLTSGSTMAERPRDAM